MLKYEFILVSVLFIVLDYQTYSQNFFPVNINDEIQCRDFEFYYDPYGSWTQDTYPVYNITDSVIINGVTFIRFGEKYLSYDSLSQELYILINGQSKLAVDFNLPEDSMQVLYYQGYPRIWKSKGRSYQNIFGSPYQVYEMKADTSYWGGGYQHQKTWGMKFASDIGFYQDTYHEWKYDMAGEYTTDERSTVVFAKIDTNLYNYYNQGIYLLDPVRNRLLNEFPYYLHFGVTHPLSGLFSALKAEFNVIRNDCLIFTRVFNIDTSIYLSLINISHNELDIGDKIEFKCILQDTSIFNNIKTDPDSGYYTFYVVSDTSASGTRGEKLNFVYSLSQNFPNPFNPKTTIKYSIGDAGTLPANLVQLRLFDVLGNEVVTLVNEEQPAGNYTVEFNGSKLSSGISAGGGYASGVYFYQLKAGDYISTKKLILLK